MKYLKMIGLTSLAALAIAAFMGVATASAANLCKANETTCSVANTYENGTTMVGKLEAGTDAVLTGALDLTCSASEVKGTVNTGGSGEITGASWTSCSPSCTVTSQSLNWEATYEPTTNGNGKLFVIEPEVKIQCLFITCTFTANSVELDVTGGSGGSEANDPKIVANEEELESNCGEGTWTATYRVTSIGGASHAPGFITN